jgi:transcriptional regulator with XRE-family HTH domain
MAQTLTEKVTRTADGKRLFEQECAIMEITELICAMMEQEGVSRSELAKRIGKTKGYVSQLLDGSANMTVRTISDILGALGRKVHFSGERALEPTYASSISWNVKEPFGQTAIATEHKWVQPNNHPDYLVV